MSAPAPLPALGELDLAMIGLGYVGLPLAVEFGKRRPVVGLDIDEARIAALQAGRDGTGEVTPEEFRAAGQLAFTADPAELAGCNLYIVSVPTPIDVHKRPDLTHLLAATDLPARLTAQPSEVAE